MKHNAVKDWRKRAYARTAVVARPTAARRCSGPDECFKEYWHPRLAGSFVHLGDPDNPRNQYETRAEAVEAARRFQNRWADWLAKQESPS